MRQILQELFGPPGLVKIAPVSINLHSDAAPYCVTTARRVPFPLIDKVKAELRKMEKAGIIQEIVEPTDWCAPNGPCS